MTHGELAELLAAWLPAQRWFAGPAAAVRSIAIRSDTTLAGGDPELRHLIVAVSLGAEVVCYQVLAGLRARLPASLAEAAIGTLDGRIVYDALADPTLTALLMRGIATQRVAGPLRFTVVAGAVIDQQAAGRTLPAEQSNTSVVFGSQTILKVFRRPHVGCHPDLEVPGALARSGSKLVAAPLGWIESAGADFAEPARRRAPDQATEPDQAAQPGHAAEPSQAAQPGHAAQPGQADREHAEGADEPTVLAVLSRYFAGARDGWSLAIASLRTPEPDFTGEARLLGQATATLHAELADAFGAIPLSRQALAELTATMDAGLDLAIAEVPALRPYRAGIRACYAELGELTSQVITQRIHGDYHLAQVLRTEGGWVVLDFEGEPSVPLALRRVYAPALRDVAGMLRSFDYAARHHLHQSPADQRLQATALDWARRCSDAFCTGYADAGGADPRAAGPLLRALLLQKSVYEVVYEARHRPGWLPIPLSAIAKAAQ